MRRYTEGSVECMLKTGNFSRVSSLLDIGCGSGEDIAHVEAASGIKMFGFDKDEARIEEGWRRNPRALLRVADAEEQNYMDKSFDGILMKRVLSEINAQKEALYLARCALREHGLLFIADYYLRLEESGVILAAQRLAADGDKDAFLHGNCETRRRKRPSHYCVGRAFVKGSLLKLLDEVGLRLISWEDASHWPESGSLDFQEGYFFLTAGRK